MSKQRLHFIDWMKCLGMALIVFGHVSVSTDRLAPPIYPKQLGVAFFMFVTGFSLALETRPRREVLFNRLFEIYLFGIAFALFLSVVNYVLISRLTLSNYLPFLLGSNVVFNNFPANPTTWYIGTYIHVLLLWALVLRGVRVRAWMIAPVCIFEIITRAVLEGFVGPYVSYMVLPNWATVFLLGVYCGQKRENEADFSRMALPLVGLGALLVVWPVASWLWLRPSAQFPFMHFGLGSELADLAVGSAATTVIYLTYTYLVYEITRRLPASGVVRFFARNTLIIFIGHMPLYSALLVLLKDWTTDYVGLVAVRFFACFVLLALFSEAIHRLIGPARLRERVWQMSFGRSLPRSETLPTKQLTTV